MAVPDYIRKVIGHIRDGKFIPKQDTVAAVVPADCQSEGGWPAEQDVLQRPDG